MRTTLPFVLLCCLPGAPAPPLPAGGAVQVEIYEDIAPGQTFDLSSAAAVDRYSEPAFAFIHTPAKFAPNAVPLDRSTPYYLRATYRRSLTGNVQFRLRARGAARFYVDGKMVAETKPQKPNTSSDDPVPPPVERGNTPLRPVVYPHQDSLVTVDLPAGEHAFELIAVVGGKGLFPSTGELAVGVSRNGEVDHLLGPDESPLLTDPAWEAYAAASFSRHYAADIVRRRAVSQEVTAAWDERHKNLRERLGTPAGGATVDGFIDARMKEAGAKPAASLTDLEFLRRLTLDTTGLIPTPDQVRAFLRDDAATRRRKAIDRLVEDPSWADHWVSYWQDVLAENPGILKPDLNNTGPFRWWMHQSFTDNIPFDRFAAELVQMEGSATLGGPASFGLATLNDAPMAAKADIIGQAFLGQKMSCARCHDAPFHPFKQKDLFSMAAMLAGKAVKLPVTSTVPQGEGGRKPAVTSALKPGETITPAWPFAKLVAHAEGDTLPAASKVDTRRELAAYIISPENERFAQVVANRVWKRYMGVGIVEPADDWSRGKASHPELLAYLSREFMASGYDIKHLAKLILNSNAYQRKPVGLSADQMSAGKRLFTGPVHRNMTAEQLVDSLHLAAGKPFDCESMNLNPAGDRPARQFLDLGNPARGWQMTALSNERDRPALALPIAQSIVDVMTTFGWRQSRQSPATDRDDAASAMQTLILANGVLGTRMARLSDDSWFTDLALSNRPVATLVEETFLRLMSRPPEAQERASFTRLLEPVYRGRIVAGAKARSTKRESDGRVSWSNHLSAEASLIRMEEERKLRFGDQPTARLTKDFRERYEDMLWALINSPEFAMVP
ncbi:MAG: DUF1553 domain-containing protein [Acidobacteria bacterium]|nr:DUF1553 domain-containing protein [Acidobacteriota bacterium]